MKIAIFGCSYTHGLPEIENGISWVKILSTKYPNIQFDNYAFMGSSVLFQINLFKQLKFKYDKIIFQITTPGRITYWLSDKKEFLNHRTIINNYSYFNYSLEDIQVVTPAIINQFKLSSPFWKTDKGKSQYAQLHYGKLNYELIDCEHEIYQDYVKANTDFCFTQKNIVEECNKDFKKDWAGHFYTDGHKWQADWVESHCKEKGIL